MFNQSCGHKFSCDKKCQQLQSRNHQKDRLQERFLALIMFITRKPRMSRVLVASLALEAPLSSGLSCKLYFIQQFVFLCPVFPIFSNVLYSLFYVKCIS